MKWETCETKPGDAQHVADGGAEIVGTRLVSSVDRLRVPGGWLYVTVTVNLNERSHDTSTVFVPNGPQAAPANPHQPGEASRILVLSTDGLDREDGNVYYSTYLLVSGHQLRHGESVFDGDGPGLTVEQTIRTLEGLGYAVQEPTVEHVIVVDDSETAAEQPTVEEPVAANPEPGMVWCPQCRGTPYLDSGDRCENCHGRGKVRAQSATADGPLDPPIPMVLLCPSCGAQHVDGPDPSTGWTNPPHKSHLCHACGTVWRPADVPTTGVPSIQTRGSADTWLPMPSDPRRTPAG